MNQVSIILKALSQLGPQRLAELATYRMGLASGHYRRLTNTPIPSGSVVPIDLHLGHLPAVETLTEVVGENAHSLLAEADEIVAGKVRLFGGQPVPLDLAPQDSLCHWTDYELGRAAWGVEDVKFLWEPARFGWAVTLARAYRLTGNDAYAQSFWRLAEIFNRSNPPYLGPNWASGQEAAVRLLCLVFAFRVFGSGEFPASFAQDLMAAHASRIPPTLVYARAQDNNHLLSEAVGLYTASAVLNGHPQALRWRALGWRWMNYCFQHQIAEDGTYIQHSMNYHRLMLQLALWAHSMAHTQGESFPPQSQSRLAAATQWLMERLDPASGRTPNLGHNDGAYILPLATGGFDDYRPVAQAASRAFLGAPYLPPGPWDEMSLWLGDHSPSDHPRRYTPDPLPHLIIHGKDSWASLRAVNYTSRPGQADQLHVDLWWRGSYIALDPGTFSYNAAPPWENAFASTIVHNTVSVDDQDQMTRAGRFLWLDWPRVHIYQLPEGDRKLAAFHEGYLKRFQVTHRRELSVEKDDVWLVVDKLLPAKNPRPHLFTLSWLLPDWPWELNEKILMLEAPAGTIKLELAHTASDQAQKLQLIRAGKVLVGPDVTSQIFGWTSPTYGLKIPALLLRFSVTAAPPLEFTTRILLG